MTYDLTPMQVCERLIGKPERIAVAASCHEKAPYHWRRERHGRSAGDMPSMQVVRALLTFSGTHNLGLTADHLIWGASEDEVAAILAARDGGQVDFATSRMAAE